MMKKWSFKWSVLFVALASAFFFAWSCGGGGGGGGGTPAAQPLTPASLDQTAAETATAMAMSSSDISEISNSFVDNIYDRASGPDLQASRSLAAWVLGRVRKGFLAGKIIRQRDDSRAGSSSESGNCDDSGTYGISGTWSGPDEPSDICNVSNLTATMTFSNCQEYGETSNGTITIHISGNLCAPTAISLSFNGLSYSDNYSAMQVEADHFDLAMTALQYSSGDLAHVQVTLNGDIALNSYSMEFAKFSEDISYSGSAQTISVSGSLTGDCLDGWVTFTTLSPVQTNGYSECPVGGGMQISGDSDMMVTFNSDGSVNIGDQTYTSCNDLPDTCQ
jgi:hypothetical protein